ncbi:MAG: hypothetical protein ACTHKR_05280 [Sphingomonas sp.]
MSWTLTAFAAFAAFLALPPGSRELTTYAVPGLVALEAGYAAQVAARMRALDKSGFPPTIRERAYLIPYAGGVLVYIAVGIGGVPVEFSRVAGCIAATIILVSKVLVGASRISPSPGRTTLK